MEIEQRLRGVDPSYQVFGLLFLVGTRLEAIGDSGQCLGELTTKQWFMLLNIRMFFESPPTLTQLAESMGTSRQNAKAIAQKLARKGFVALERDARDARALRIRVLPKADEYELANGRQNDAFLRAFMGVLSAEETQTMQSCLLRLSDQAQRMRRMHAETQDKEDAQNG